VIKRNTNKAAIMNQMRPGTILDIPHVQEKYGMSLAASLVAHAAVFLVFVYGGLILPTATIQIGSGAGAEPAAIFRRWESWMIFPEGSHDKAFPGSETAGAFGRNTDRSGKSNPLPQTVDPKKKKPAKIDEKATRAISPKSNVIPVAPEPGSGGVGGRSGGSGGGIGDGNGVSIGSGSGGFGIPGMRGRWNRESALTGYARPKAFALK